MQCIHSLACLCEPYQWFRTLLVLSCFVPLSLHAQGVSDSLTARLAQTEGADRLDVLEALVEANVRNAPEEAITYGREALVLLRTYPNLEQHIQILFIKGWAHYYLAEYDSVSTHAAALATLSGQQGIGAAHAAQLEGQVLRRAGDYEDALRAYERAYTQYEALGDSLKMADLLSFSAITHRVKGDYDTTLQFYHEALSLYEQIGDQLGMARVLNGIGTTYRRQGDFEAALPILNRSLALREAVGDVRGASSTLNSIGLVHENQGDFAAALETYGRSLTLAESINDKIGIGNLLNNIADIYLDQGLYDDARTYFERALTLREELGLSTSIAASLNNLGLVEQRTGNLEAALDYYTRSLTIKEEIGNRLAMGNTLLNIGSVHQEQENYTEATDYFRQALGLYEDVGYSEGIVNAQLNLGQAYLAEGQLDEALRFTTEATVVADSIGVLPRLRTAYEQRAEILKGMSRFEEALAAYEAFKAVDDSLFNSESQGVIAELAAQYRTREQRQRIELLESNRKQQRLWMALLLGGVGVLVIIVAMQVGRMRLRRRALAAIEEAQAATEEKATELQQKTIELEQANEMQSRFLANISHEFRTPLTLTFGPLDDALQGRFGSFDEARPHFESARRNGGRLLRLINQLLDLSKLDAGALLLQTRTHDLAAHLRSLTALFDSIAQNRQIDFTVQIPDGEVVHVYDNDKIEKVVINLLSNAFKFTDPGGKISLKLSQKADGTACIEVADTGKGIAEEHLAHLFDRFYQADSDTTRMHEGTGIGLALVKELVELHEGTITVQSTVGFGTQFWVQLPPLTIADTGVSPTDPAEQANDIKSGTLGDGAAQSITGSLTIPLDLREDAEAKDPAASEEEAADETVVLIVEDNADMRAYIRRHLEDIASVVEAENGRLGVERAVETVPDLILSDVMMPEMDGLELCATVKKDKRTSHIPVVLLTAKAQVEDRIAGYESGADAYLPKPFNAEELQVRVQTLVEERRRLRAAFRGLAPAEDSDDASVFEGLPPGEAAFLEQVYAHIEDKLGDSSFGAEQLAEAFHMSLRQFHRKLKALCDETPAALIRRLRLERAAKLLLQGEMAVKEVAYTVGYVSNSSFSRLFQKTYGVPPTEYTDQHTAPPNRG